MEHRLYEDMKREGKLWKSLLVSCHDFGTLMLRLSTCACEIGRETICPRDREIIQIQAHNL